MSDFTVSFAVPQSADEVFAAINDVRGWWSGDIDGSTDELGAEFTYQYQDMHRSKQRITEFVPGRRVAWRVLEGYIDFVKDKAEWTGTDITFDISPSATGTEVRFTHVGLAPEAECFETCSSAWGFYISSSLRDLITQRQRSPQRLGCWFPASRGDVVQRALTRTCGASAGGVVSWDRSGRTRFRRGEVAPRRSACRL